jgi:hypothetical protein
MIRFIREYYVSLIALLIVITVLCMTVVTPKPSYTYHKCIDLTHATCDGKCECDGLGCRESIEHGEK